MVRKNLPLLSSFLRFDRKCSELGPTLIMKAGSAPVKIKKNKYVGGEISIEILKESEFTFECLKKLYNSLN